MTHGQQSSLSTARTNIHVRTHPRSMHACKCSYTGLHGGRGGRATAAPASSNTPGTRCPAPLLLPRPTLASAGGPRGTERREAGAARPVPFALCSPPPPPPPPPILTCTCTPKPIPCLTACLPAWAYIYELRPARPVACAWPPPPHPLSAPPRAPVHHPHPHPSHHSRLEAALAAGSGMPNGPSAPSPPAPFPWHMPPPIRKPKSKNILALPSGMLPGYVAGLYSYDACHVDLAKLGAFARARLVHAEACGLDLKVGRAGPGQGGVAGVGGWVGEAGRRAGGRRMRSGSRSGLLQHAEAAGLDLGGVVGEAGGRAPDEIWISRRAGVERITVGRTGQCRR